MCIILEKVIDFNVVAVYLKHQNSLLLKICKKINSLFRDKYNIEHTTVLTSALRDVTIRICFRLNSWYNYLYLAKYTQPLFGTALYITNMHDLFNEH